MATAHIHNFLKRNTYSADVYKPPGSFDHEADGKVVEGSRRNMDTGNRSALFPIKNMPRRSSAYAKEVKRWDCTILPEYFMTRKLYVKFILTVLNVSRGSSLSTRNAILLYTNHVTAISFICPCEMNLSYWLFFYYLFLVQNIFTNVLPNNISHFGILLPHFCLLQLQQDIHTLSCTTAGSVFFFSVFWKNQVNDSSYFCILRKPFP